MINQTKQLIIELSDFRDKIRLHIANDTSNALVLTNDYGDSYKISQKELETINKIIEAKPELQEKAYGLHLACIILINLFNNELR